MSQSSLTAVGCAHPVGVSELRLAASPPPCGKSRRRAPSFQKGAPRCHPAPKCSKHLRVCSSPCPVRQSAGSAFWPRRHRRHRRHPRHPSWPSFATRAPRRPFKPSCTSPALAPWLSLRGTGHRGFQEAPVSCRDAGASPPTPLITRLPKSMEPWADDRLLSVADNRLPSGAGQAASATSLTTRRVLAFPLLSVPKNRWSSASRSSRQARGRRETWTL